MSEVDQHNGQHDQDERKAESAVAPAPVDPMTEIARLAQIQRATWVAEADQLEAQRAELHEQIKLLRARIENSDKISGNATKVVKARGRTAPAASTAAKGRK